MNSKKLTPVFSSNNLKMARFVTLSKHAAWMANSHLYVTEGSPTISMLKHIILPKGHAGNGLIECYITFHYHHCHRQTIKQQEIVKIKQLFYLIIQEQAIPNPTLFWECLTQQVGLNWFSYDCHPKRWKATDLKTILINIC